MPILKKCSFTITVYLFLIVFFIIFTGTANLFPPLYISPAFASWESDTLLSNISRQIGSQDGAVLCDPEGNLLFSKNENLALIPASTLKILTALFSLENLGENFKFKTRIYTDNSGNLKIKGEGDPLLLSEYVDTICSELSKTVPAFKDLILDTSYFDHPLVIPGISDSLEPYDAPNGAFCVNFNTVSFKREKDGRFVSAEPQTPLLPFVLNRIRASKLSYGRIMLSSKADECSLYAGHLFLNFLKRHGIKGGSAVRMGIVDEKKDQLVYTYASKNALDVTIAMMLEYSNNFMANQLLMTTAAKIYGKPGSLDNGVKAIRDYAGSILNISGVTIQEGSGISRKNKVTAMSMLKVLDRFEPYYGLMRKDGPVYYKTGTLQGIRTRVGYIIDDNGSRYKFVILINTPRKMDIPVLKNFIKLTQIYRK